MTESDAPQLYLVSPPEFGLSDFPKTLAHVLDAHEVACVRLALATWEEDRISRAADALREVCHAAEVALVIDTHSGLVERLGLDGVHLTDGSRSVRNVRKSLGGDAIVGAFCGASRHDGMTAAEQGADYVAFGPVRDTGLGDGSIAERGLFEWWSEVIEVPIVAEGAHDTATVASLGNVTDFLALGEELWSTDDPVATLSALKAAMAPG
ncbi:MAG: thiamine phosphate synthase [Pseudomonadota bacterium]